MSALTISDERTNNDFRLEGTNPAAHVDQLRRANGCEHPIQLRGSQTQNGNVIWSTSELPGQVAYVACKTRRKARCEPCARVYQGDAFALIASGLRGGKGVSESISSHPAWFVTFTAPSFGPVHAIGSNGYCRPRRSGQSCEHGNDISCNRKHSDGDPLLGQPLCKDCFDYQGAVVWNAHAGLLWRMTRIGIDRALAKLVGISYRASREVFRTQYVKVAEFQKRGLVHFHVAFRLDGHNGEEPSAQASELFTQAVRQGATSTTVTGPYGSIGWGKQLDIKPIVADDPDESNHDNNTPTRGRVAGYLAKYSTKGSDDFGALDCRLNHEQEIDYLRLNDHIARLVRTSWRLAHRFSELNTAHWSHQLGYRGHFCTKSRNWSTTFSALRKARADYQRDLRDKSWQSLSEHARGAIQSRWQFVASGYRTPTDAWIGELIRQQRHSNRAA